jgi:hypothetical protein
MLEQILMIGVLAAAAAGISDQSGGIEKSFALNDGSSVHIFKDGKMAMEDKFGHVVPMQEGIVMQTIGGERIRMVGNETARLEGIHRAQPNGW